MGASWELLKNKTRWKNCRKAKKLYFLNTDIGNLYIKEKIMIFFHFKHFLWMLRLLLKPSKKISKTKNIFFITLYIETSMIQDLIIKK